MINPNNISSLTNPDLISLAKNQLTQQQDKIKQTVLTKADKLQKQLKESFLERKRIDDEYNELIKKVQSDNSLSEEDKVNQINNLQEKRLNEISLLEEKEKKVKDDIFTINKDPLKQIKEEKKKIDLKINKSIKKSQSDQKKASVTRRKQIAQNVKKTLPVIVMSTLVPILIKLTQQNNKLQELVDKTNDFIRSANTPEKINQARILRNTALNIINSQEQKIISIRNTLKRIQSILNVFSTILSIINVILNLPLPFLIIGPIKVRLQPILQRILAILNSLTVVLAIVIPLLESIIAYLEDLKRQLLAINDLLDTIASSNISNLNDILNITEGIGGEFGAITFEEYKGFKFALKEENNPDRKFTIRGNKRHYAVAIDRDNVEVLKSDLSFTLDPNDLIEQLKLIIDQRNLQA
jgi:hypothetical protein